MAPRCNEARALQAGSERSNRKLAEDAWIADDDAADHHGYLYLRGTYTALDDPSQTLTSTVAYGVSGSGQIVGSYYSTGRDGCTEALMLAHSFAAS